MMLTTAVATAVDTLKWPTIRPRRHDQRQQDGAERGRPGGEDCTTQSGRIAGFVHSGGSILPGSSSVSPPTAMTENRQKPSVPAFPPGRKNFIAAHTPCQHRLAVT